jgi:hypothetical protein
MSQIAVALLFAQALIAVLCSSRKRSSLCFDERTQPGDGLTHRREPDIPA